MNLFMGRINRVKKVVILQKFLGVELYFHAFSCIVQNLKQAQNATPWCYSLWCWKKRYDLPGRVQYSLTSLY